VVWADGSLERTPNIRPSSPGAVVALLPFRMDFTKPGVKRVTA
jgi:hypothetical protein